MASGHYPMVLRQLHRLFQRGSAAGLTEGQLLERFLQARDEAAFEALVARHGPMVLAVCRQVLDDPHDVEDAFQATFLVLVRKAAGIRDRSLLGNWLYGVAQRVSLRARTHAARRRVRERGRGLRDEEEPVTDASDPARGELAPVLHEEIGRLPEKYRAPTVLCYLEGLTHEAAALELRWPVGTVKGRLARARELLKGRLTRRGLALPAGVLATALPRPVSAVPESLIRSTVQAAIRFAAGPATAAGALSAGAVALTEGVLQTMFVSKLKTAAAVLAASAALTGAGVLAFQPGGDGDRAGAGRPAQPAPVAKAQIKDHPDSGQGPDLAELEKARVEAAHAAYDKLAALYEKGSIEPTVLIPWSRRWLEAQIVQSKDLAGVTSALEDHLARMRKLEKEAKDRPQANQASSASVAEVEFFRKEAEVWLAEVKAGKVPAWVGASLPNLVPVERPKAANEQQPQAGMMGGMMAGGMGSMKGAQNPTAGMKGPMMMMGGMGGAAPAMGGMMGGGGVGGGGGFDGGSDERPEFRPPSFKDARKNPRNKPIVDVLDRSLKLSFAQETPLADVLEFLKANLKDADGKPIPIYVDPIGLQEAERTIDSPIQIDVDGVPLRTALRLVLRTLGLTCFVRDGVLIITSESSDLLDPRSPVFEDSE